MNSKSVARILKSKHKYTSYGPDKPRQMHAYTSKYYCVDNVSLSTSRLKKNGISVLMILNF